MNTPPQPYYILVENTNEVRYIGNFSDVDAAMACMFKQVGFEEAYIIIAHSDLRSLINVLSHLSLQGPPI